VSEASTGSIKGTSGGITATHPPVEFLPVLAAPTDEKDTNTLRTPFVAIACWRLEDLRFEFGSSFIKPEAAVEFAQLAELVKGHPDAPLSIFGHADPVGLDENNKTLSGRRAASVYGILTRRTEIWEDIYSQGGKYTAPHEKDKWGTKVIQIILDDLGYSPGPINGEMGDETREAVKGFQADQSLKVDGKPGKETREKLFFAYMDKHCRDGKGDPFKLDAEAFLGEGKDSYGKGDYQGCGEFNPQMLFSKEEQKKYQQQENKEERDKENAVNRRVMILLFRPGNNVEPKEWPCPRAKEGPSGCKKRFWSDGEDRRSQRLATERRTYEETRGTFACRFYDRLAITSPCETLMTHATFYYGLQIGSSMPWTEAASVSFISEDGLQSSTFPVSQADAVGIYRVVAFPDWRPGVRYKGEVKEGHRTTQLFGYCELSNLQQSPKALNLLAVPAPKDDSANQKDEHPEPDSIDDLFSTDLTSEEPTVTDEERAATEDAAKSHTSLATFY
jgi:hypothetical protein